MDVQLARHTESKMANDASLKWRERTPESTVGQPMWQSIGREHTLNIRWNIRNDVVSRLFTTLIPPASDRLPLGHREAKRQTLQLIAAPLRAWGPSWLFVVAECYRPGVMA
eukprot:2269795-Pyramimonas_sp.AAC.1